MSITFCTMENAIEAGYIQLTGVIFQNNRIRIKIVDASGHNYHGYASKAQIEKLSDDCHWIPAMAIPPVFSHSVYFSKEINRTGAPGCYGIRFASKDIEALIAKAKELEEKGKAKHVS